VAIGLIVIRTRQYLCAVLPVGNALLLNTLRYADEVLPAEPYAPAATTLDKAKVSQREFGMAVKLVEDMRQDWQPGKYHDTYREDLLRRIEAKVQAGQTKSLTPPSTKPEKRRTAEVVDLSELLQRSLAQRGKSGGTQRSSRAQDEPEAQAAPAARRASRSSAAAHGRAASATGSRRRRA
jgi:DNA end-binding protein Ku